MATSGAKVNFVQISASDFENLAEKDENTIYFVSDPTTQNTVYLGSDKYGSSVEYPNGDNEQFGS